MVVSVVTMIHMVFVFLRGVIVMVHVFFVRARVQERESAHEHVHVGCCMRGLVICPRTYAEPQACSIQER